MLGDGSKSMAHGYGWNMLNDANAAISAALILGHGGNIEPSARQICKVCKDQGGIERVGAGGRVSNSL